MSVVVGGKVFFYALERGRWSRKLGYVIVKDSRYVNFLRAPVRSAMNMRG